MKKKLIILLIALTSNLIFGQITTDKNIRYTKALKERLFIHYNSSVVLAGENLHYKVYCIRDRNNKLSLLSKVAYVHLINDENKIIVTQKIRLQQGKGSGSYAVPRTLATGHYKLVAYTQWMRNEGDTYFFKGDIVVVNLFDENQLFSVHKTSSLAKNILLRKENTTPISVNTNGNISINLPKKTYKSREKVNLKIVTGQSGSFFGNYSLSVRKIDQISKPKEITVLDYINIYKNQESKNNYGKEVKFLPEFKGSTLTGKVTNIKTKEPVANTKVVLSVSDKKYKFRFAITNSEGIFTFVFKRPNTDKNVILQIVDKKKEKYRLSIINKPQFIPNKLIFKKVEIHPNIKNILLERHINNQIEQAYVKDIKDPLAFDPFIDEEMLRNTTNYYLDDYHRFATLKETIVEIIKSVWITKRKGNYIFHVRKRNPYDYETTKESPLVIIDGVFIQDYNKIVEFDASEIKKISVVKRRLSYSDYVFEGIVFIETFDKNYKKDSFSNYLKNVTLIVPKLGKDINRKYSTSNFSEENIPDYRNQLLWKPNLEIEQTTTYSNFFTSDVTGTFEILLEGFNKKGTPVFLKTIFNVTK